tara:strand:- start:142 stop:261 length:120 start_codon:yes stop_codon:yes gene_type:complete
MSIIYCYECDKRVDSDYEEIYYKGLELICEICKEENDEL